MEVQVSKKRKKHLIGLRGKRGFDENATTIRGTLIGDVDLMQKLREKAGLLEAPWLRTEAKSQQVRLEDLPLHFVEFHSCSSR